MRRSRSCAAMLALALLGSLGSAHAGEPDLADANALHSPNPAVPAVLDPANANNDPANERAARPQGPDPSDALATNVEQVNAWGRVLDTSLRRAQQAQPADRAHADRLAVTQDQWKNYVEAQCYTEGALAPATASDDTAVATALACVLRETQQRVSWLNRVAALR